MKYINWAFAAIVVAGFIVTGCSDADTETSVAVTKVTLDKNEIYLPVGENETLSATVQAADKTVSWSSSKEAVATVNGGTVTGVADGIAIITVATNDGGTADCLVIVGAGVESVTLNKSVLTLRMGKTETLSATVLPEDALNITVTWSSSATTVATVSNGTIPPVAVGTATITVTTAEGTRTAACNLTVISVPPINGMVWIDSGTFMMGSPVSEPESLENETLHQVTLTKGFYMGETEVTQGQYFEVMGYNPSYFYNEGRSQGFYNADYYRDGWKNYPVEYITWYDAVEFCIKLSEKEGLTPAYTMHNRQPLTGYPIDGVDWDIFEIVTTVTCNWSANGYRLPTEAEWEYACRAGTTTPFNVGNSISSGLNGQANYDGEWLPYNGAPAGRYLGYPTPVRWYAPNAWGLYDMHGNLKEWCWDLFIDYRSSATGQTETDPRGPDSSEYNDSVLPRVLRGGSWYDSGGDVRSARRYYYPAGDFWINSMRHGFRVVRPLNEPRS
jgi:formylglycine-generating enzyme required for sulfatase activity